MILKETYSDAQSVENAAIVAALKRAAWMHDVIECDTGAQYQLRAHISEGNEYFILEAYNDADASDDEDSAHYRVIGFACSTDDSDAFVVLDNSRVTFSDALRAITEQMIIDRHG